MASPSVKFALLLTCWYLLTLWSNMSGKSFVKRTLDAVSPTTVSLGCALTVHLLREIFTKAPKDGRFNADLHKWAALVGYIQFMATVMTYASFALSSVSWTYCFRTLEPLISAALQFVVCNERLTKKEITALAVLAAGIVVTVNAASQTQVYSAWVGGLAFTATAIYSTRSVTGSRVMRQFQIGGQDLFLLASAYGFVFSTWTQITVSVFQGVSLFEIPWGLMGQLMFTGIFHCAYNLLSFRILEMLQPVAHGVCNTMKRVFMVVISAGLSGQWLTPVQLGGIMMANGAAAVYSTEVKRRRQQQQQQNLIPTHSSKEEDNSGVNKDGVLPERQEIKNPAEMGRLGIWLTGTLLIGVLYLGFSLSALAAWKTSRESQQPDWDPQLFFTDLFSSFKSAK